MCWDSAVTEPHQKSPIFGRISIRILDSGTTTTSGHWFSYNTEQHEMAALTRLLFKTWHSAFFPQSHTFPDVQEVTTQAEERCKHTAGRRLQGLGFYSERGTERERETSRTDKTKPCPIFPPLILALGVECPPKEDNPWWWSEKC